MEKYDAIIIGFGKGGKTLAVELANRNWKVAVIEASAKMYGGTCINIGCIPTKTLVHQAKIAGMHKGLPFEMKNEFFQRAIQKKEEVTSILRQKNYEKLSGHENITVYTGIGSFASPEVIRVDLGAEQLEIASEHIFINTGAITVIPPIPGIQDNPYVFTSTSIMQLAELPRRMVIVGGGYIGLEFASIYTSFGTEVTVLEGYAELIPREDRDIAIHVKETLEKKGVTFEMNAKVETIKDNKVTYRNTQSGDTQVLETDVILLATGRKPNTEGLNLALAGVKIDERGTIIVDDYLKTTNPKIRAIGDVKGGLQFTYISLDDYRIIREDLFGEKERRLSDRRLVSYSVFIDPPLSRIGMNEEEARKKGLNIKVNKLPVAAIPRTKTIGESEGILKAIIDLQTDQILGCTLFCPESSEIINIVALAMKTGLKAKDLRDFIYTHPSMSEAFNDLFA